MVILVSLLAGKIEFRSKDKFQSFVFLETLPMVQTRKVQLNEKLTYGSDLMNSLTGNTQPKAGSMNKYSEFIKNKQQFRTVSTIV